MKNIAEKYHKSVPAVAIRFILDYIPDSIVLCGAKRPSQVEGNAEGMDWILKKEDIQMLNDISKVNNARVSVGVVDLNRKLSIMQLENLKEAA
jgi:diketogulonate reductase-like aldo/keto reductase